MGMWIHLSLLAAGYSIINSCSHARLEMKLNLFISQVRAGRREGSIVSIQTIDTVARNNQGKWDVLRRDLEDAGISPAAISENRQFIIAWFQEAVAAGKLEEDTPSDADESLLVLQEFDDASSDSDTASASSKEELLRDITGAPYLLKKQVPGLVMERPTLNKGHVIKRTSDSGSIESSRSPSVNSEYAREEKASTLPSSFDREPSFQITVPLDKSSVDADTQSVISERDEIGSLLSTTRSPQALLAENHLALVLAKSDALSPLLDEALTKVGQDRFIQNVRRLLKTCYLDLLPHAKTNLEKTTNSLLRSRPSRVRVARLIIDMRNPENDEDREQNFSVVQSKLKYLEDWIASHAGLAPSPLPDEDDDGDLEDNVRSESDMSDVESGDENQNVDLPNISQMETFLVEAQAFKNLVVNLHIFLCPATMKPIIRSLLSVLPDRISFSTKNNYSVCNRMKILAEHVTEDEWNWWPLQPKMRFLKEDETRVLWTCVSKGWALIITFTEQVAALWNPALVRIIRDRCRKTTVTVAIQRTYDSRRESL